MSSTFIGRRDELLKLKQLHQKQRPHLVVIKGRRRVGKSRLVEFFAAETIKTRFLDFAGLAPEKGMSDQQQRDHFAQQLATQLDTNPFHFQDWSEAFKALGGFIQAGDVVLLDEISWMGHGDISFIPKFKAWWDKQTKPYMLVICGSVSTWIEENVLNSTALFGRINLTMTLDPLPIPDACQLLRASGFKGSSYEVFRILSVFGGIPWYLEQIQSGHTAQHWIEQLCLEKDGLLVLEFDRLFHDLFNGRGSTYKKILESLKDGMRTLVEIRNHMDYPASGVLSRMIDHLRIAGFIEKQQLWSFKTRNPLKQSLYRIGDPYMRFYLKVIEPRRNSIDISGFAQDEAVYVKGIDAHFGLQLEHLLLQNRRLLIQALGIHRQDIIASGPYRQTQTQTKPGCQIDFLVQTMTKTLFVCEFKFRRQELGSEIMNEVEKKIKALKIPRGFSCVPVLFHIGGVSDHVAISDYFYRIIDINDFICDCSPGGGSEPNGDLKRK